MASENKYYFYKIRNIKNHVNKYADRRIIHMAESTAAVLQDMSNCFGYVSDTYQFKAMRHADTGCTAHGHDALLKSEPADFGETKLGCGYHAKFTRKPNLAESGGSVAYGGIFQAGGDRENCGEIGRGSSSLRPPTTFIYASQFDTTRPARFSSTARRSMALL